MKRVLLVVLASLLVGLGSVGSVQAGPFQDDCTTCVEIKCSRECSEWSGDRVSCARCIDRQCDLVCR